MKYNNNDDEEKKEDGRSEQFVFLDKKNHFLTLLIEYLGFDEN